MWYIIRLISDQWKWKFSIHVRPSRWTNGNSTPYLLEMGVVKNVSTTVQHMKEYPIPLERILLFLLFQSTLPLRLICEIQGWFPEWNRTPSPWSLADSSKESDLDAMMRMACGATPRTGSGKARGSFDATTPRISDLKRRISDTGVL